MKDIKKFAIDNKGAVENAFIEVTGKLPNNKNTKKLSNKEVEANFNKFRDTGKSLKEIDDIKAKENSTNKQEMKKCPYCENDFVPNKDHKVYCCDKCRVKYYGG